MFKRQITEADQAVNQGIRVIATGDESWLLRKKSEFLHRWADIFNKEFFDSALPTPSISFEATRKEVLGHFVHGRNHYGLRYNINLNRQHLYRSDAEHLETLVHEQIHLYQEITDTAPGTVNYHNRAFVDKAQQIGLKAMLGRGCHIGAPQDPFVALLKEHSVSFDAPRVPAAGATPPKARKPRLKRWSCGCKAVWCGGELEARCLRCGGLFLLSPL
jgi:hypothetical protein